MFKVADFEIDDDIGAQESVVKNEVDIEMAIIEGETLLPSFKEKAFAEFAQS
jgi:hypothetical protein